jgi:hypothetical protein
MEFEIGYLQMYYENEVDLDQTMELAIDNLHGQEILMISQQHDTETVIYSDEQVQRSEDGMFTNFISILITMKLKVQSAYAYKVGYILNKRSYDFNRAEREENRQMYTNHIQFYVNLRNFLEVFNLEINQKIDTNFSILNNSLGAIGQGIQNNLIMTQEATEKTLIYINENFSLVFEAMQQLMTHMVNIQTNNSNVESLFTSVLPIMGII